MTVPILETTDVICSSLYLRAAQGRINHTEGSNGVVFCTPRIRKHQSVLCTPQSLYKTRHSVCNPTE